MSSISNYVAPRGLIAGRFMKSLVIGKGQMVDAIAYAMGRANAWQATTPELFSALRSWPDLVTKTAVVANDSSNSAGVYIPDRIIGDFMPLVSANSILGRLTGVRKFPPNSAVCAFTAGTSASLIDEGGRIPVSKAALATLTLTPRKVAGLCVISMETALGQTSDVALANDLARAVALATDQATFDPNQSYSVSNACTSFVSTGATLTTIDADLAHAIRLLAASSADQSLLNASWVMSTAYAAFLATLRGTAGAPAYPEITALGGTLLGIPVITSAAVSVSGSPQLGVVLLVDGSQIAVNNNDAVGIDASAQGSLVMDSAPGSGAQQEVSLFSTNSVALLALRWIAMARQQTSSVVAITSCSWV